jgi:hypothetical protein
LVMIYHILKHQVSYRELGADHFNKLNAAYVQRHHVNRAWKALDLKSSLSPFPRLHKH